MQRIGPLGAADGGNRTSRSSEIGHGQPVSACLPSCVPVLGAPNVVGVPVIVGAPFWMYGHVGVLSAEIDGVEGGVISLRGVSKLTAGANGLGLSATDGGLRPPPSISVEPSGMPTGPTDEPGPIDEASGTDAVADAAHGPGAVAVMPPPSKSALPDNVVLEFPVAAYAPVAEAPAHVAPIKGEAPKGSRVRSRLWEFRCARPAHWQCQAARLSQAAGGGTHSGRLAHKQSRNPKGLPPSLSQRVSAWNLTLSLLGVPTAATSAARERISGQSSAEGSSRRQNDHRLA